MVPRERIRELVIRVILDNQESSGRPLPQIELITDDFCPIGDLEGFDSYSAVETVVELSDLLDCEIDERVFGVRTQDRYATLKEMVDNLYSIVNPRGAVVNE